MISPTIQAENLEGRALTLPADLEGAYNVLFIAFQRDQQVDIDSWLPVVKQLVEVYPALAYYELPTRGSLHAALLHGLPHQPGQ